MNIELNLYEHTCPERGCGVTFFTTNGFDDRRREDHKDIYCPNGHSLSYPGETQEQKLKKEKERANILEKELKLVRDNLRICEARKNHKKIKKS